MEELVEQYKDMALAVVGIISTGCLVSASAETVKQVVTAFLQSVLFR